MEIKYQHHKRKTEQALPTWRKIAAQFNEGIPVQKIRLRFTNPQTGKPYSRSHIYYILKTLAELDDVNKVS